MPAMLIYISNWFTRRERSRANTLLVLGNPVTVLWMSIVSGYLINAFGWRQMFILEGVPALVWAVVWWQIVRDKPEQVCWLNDDEKQALNRALAEEQQQIQPMRNLSRALRSRNVVILCLLHAFWSIGVYGFMMWMPSILRMVAVIDIVQTGWLSAAPYLAAIITMLVVSWLSDKSGLRRRFIWPLLLIASVTFFGSWWLGSYSFRLSYSLLVLAAACMYAPYGPFFALIPELLPKNVAGISIGLINCCGAAGAFLGAWLVGYLNGISGGPGASYTFMAITLLVAVGLVFLLRIPSGTLILADNSD